MCSLELSTGGSKLHSHYSRSRRRHHARLQVIRNHIRRSTSHRGRRSSRSSLGTSSNSFTSRHSSAFIDYRSNDKTAVLGQRQRQHRDNVNLRTVHQTTSDRYELVFLLASVVNYMIIDYYTPRLLNCIFG